MKALTIRQPWAAAIFAGLNSKDVENRSQNWAYRGEVAIHTGQQLADGDSFAKVEDVTGVPVPVLDPFVSGCRWAVGAFIGVADIVDVHHWDSCHGACSPWWAQTGKHHLVLARRRQLNRPITANGRLGLWTPEVAMVAEIRKGLTR